MIRFSLLNLKSMQLFNCCRSYSERRSSTIINGEYCDYSSVRQISPTVVSLLSIHKTSIFFIATWKYRLTENVIRLTDIFSMKDKSTSIFLASTVVRSSFAVLHSQNSSQSSVCYAWNRIWNKKKLKIRCSSHKTVIGHKTVISIPTLIKPNVAPRHFRPNTSREHNHFNYSTSNSPFNKTGHQNADCPKFLGQLKNRSSTQRPYRTEIKEPLLIN